MRSAIFLIILSFTTMSYSFITFNVDGKGMFKHLIMGRCLEEIIISCCKNLNYWNSTFITFLDISIMEPNSRCPDNPFLSGPTDHLLTKDECHIAFEAIRQAYPDARNCLSNQEIWIDRPVHCIYHLPSKCVYWNQGKKGRYGTENPQVVPICSGKLQSITRAPKTLIRYFIL